MEIGAGVETYLAAIVRSAAHHNDNNSFLHRLAFFCLYVVMDLSLYAQMFWMWKGLRK